MMKKMLLNCWKYKWPFCVVWATNFIGFMFDKSGKNFLTLLWMSGLLAIALTVAMTAVAKIHKNIYRNLE